MSRANPFGDLDDFATPATPRPVQSEAIDQLAEASGFPSRKAQGRESGAGQGNGQEPKQGAAPAAPAARAPRRHTTGRNRQINIKATEETIDTLYRVADGLGLPLGAVLERALAALEKQDKAK